MPAVTCVAIWLKKDILKDSTPASKASGTVCGCYERCSYEPTKRCVASVHSIAVVRFCYWEAHDIPASANKHAVRFHGSLYEMHILSAKKSVASFAMALQGRADACMARLHNRRMSSLPSRF